MLSLAQVRPLLTRLNGEPADALETDQLECKPWRPDQRDACIRELRETAVSFANAHGGVILVGIEDRQRTRASAIRGVGTLSVDELRKRIYDGTDPHILVDIEDLVEPEGRLLVVRVPRGIPPHTTSEGVAKIRVGKESKPLTGALLASLLFSGGQRDLTAEVVPEATLADLDPDQIRGLQRTVESGGVPQGGFARLPTDELLQNLELVGGGGVTLAAVLLVGRSEALARWAPQHEVTLLRYATQTAYELRHDWKGSLLSVLESVQRVLEGAIKLALVPAGGGFAELTLPDITWFAAREAVLNALVHRDYFLRQPVQIELHADRVVVVSPGGFTGGVTPANILRHPPVRRNQALASALQKIGLVNRAGMGVDRIYEELLRIGKGMPRYEGDEAHVRLTLPTRTHESFARFVAEEVRAGRRLELDDLIGLRAVTERGVLDRWSAAERLQVTDDEAADRLVSLRERGYLAPEGRGRGTSYHLARRLSDALRGPDETNRDMLLDDEAVRLRVQSVLAERGKLTNAEARRLTGYSRTEVRRLMQRLRDARLVKIKGTGRGAHYIPGSGLSSSRRKR